MDKVTLSPSKAICTIFAQPFSAHSDENPYKSLIIVGKFFSHGSGDAIERTVGLWHTSDNHILRFQHQCCVQDACYPDSNSQR